MKSRNHIALLAGFFASLALEILLFFWDAPLDLLELRIVLCFSFSVVPAFCLQLWLCRLENVRRARWLPLGTLCLMALIGAAYLFGLVGSGWDSLGGGVLLCWCIAPAAGCVLGWMAHGGKLPRRLGAAGLAVLLAVYVGLRIMGGIVLRFELMDLLALAVLAAGVWLLFGKERRVRKRENKS